MDKIIIEGGVPLNGTVTISGSKNAVLPILAATILTSGKNELENVPRVKDVTTMIKLLQDLGAELNFFEKDKVVLDSSSIYKSEAPYDLVSTMRASCLVLGPLLARFGKARVSLPGGCAIGARPINLHLKGFRDLGAEIDLNNGYIEGTVKKLKGARVFFDTVTVTGTANLMMAASLAEGETILENSAKEPEVIFLAEILNRAGAKIEGAGSDTIIIQGVSSLKPISCRILPDRIETGTYMIAAAVTEGEVEVVNCVPEHVESLIQKMREAGVEIVCGTSSIKTKYANPILSVDIKTHPYPGFPTDFQAQFMAMMTLASGQSAIMETVFENRFMHAAELGRMGANITIEGHTAIVRGTSNLCGAPVMATDLRASASLILAGLAAKGETVISRVYHIDRGYEEMEKKLSRLGANIRRSK
jgi:UDP-N-acetylglucosamine 1-carboxyvinyltransferase